MSEPNWKNEAEKYKRLYEQQVEISRTLKADIGVIRKSLRDQFAMAALQGQCVANGEDTSLRDWNHEGIAEGCYLIADAMLKVRGVAP